MYKVSVIIPVYNQLPLTINCLKDLLLTTNVELEIIVVDDASKDQTKLIIPKLFPSIKFISNKTNLGFAKTVNAGINISSNNLICLLNNDIRTPNKNWLKMMCDNLNTCDLTSVAGGRLSEKTLEYIPGEAKSNKDKFSYLAFWCVLIKKEVFDKIGKIPEDFNKALFEDTLFCYRAKKLGFKMKITENTEVQHLYHTTLKAEKFNLEKEYKEKRKIFLEIAKKENLI